jgi:hypothetical protein
MSIERYAVKKGARRPGARVTTETLPLRATTWVETTSGHTMSFRFKHGDSGTVLKLIGVQPPIEGIDTQNDEIVVPGAKIEKRQPFSLESVQHDLGVTAFIAKGVESNVEPIEAA